MRLAGMLIAILIFSTCVVGMSSFYIGTAAKYNMSPSGLATTNRTQEIVDELEKTRSDLTKARGGIVNSGYAILDSIYNVIRLPLNFIDIMSAMFLDMTSLAHIAVPGWVLALVTGCIVIVFVFGIISFIKGYDA